MASLRDATFDTPSLRSPLRYSLEAILFGAFVVFLSSLHAPSLRFGATRKAPQLRAAKFVGSLRDPPHVRDAESTARSDDGATAPSVDLSDVDTYRLTREINSLARRLFFVRTNVFAEGIDTRRSRVSLRRRSRRSTIRRSRIVSMAKPSTSVREANR